jgi:hypothetical protein
VHYNEVVNKFCPAIVIKDYGGVLLWKDKYKIQKLRKAV